MRLYRGGKHRQRVYQFRRLVASHLVKGVGDKTRFTRRKTRARHNKGRGRPHKRIFSGFSHALMTNARQTYRYTCIHSYNILYPPVADCDDICCVTRNFKKFLILYIRHNIPIYIS